MSENDLMFMPDSMIAGMLMHISSEIHHSHRALVDEARRRLALSHESRWIPVEERLPEADVYVVVLHQNGLFNITFILKYTTEWATISKVTHWMPLPELPKEVQG